MSPARSSRDGDERAISPVIGVALLVVIVVLLAVTVGTMAFGFTDRLDQPVMIEDEQACPGFQGVEFEAGGGDFSQLLQELQENNCALWLSAEDVEEEGGTVQQWTDRGPNDFHAGQSDPDDRPELVTDAEVGTDVLEFDAEQNIADENDPAEDATSGDYLRIDRNADELGIDEDSGFVIVAALKVEEFDRGGPWTVGEAGADGREFSMRTCSDLGVDGCTVGSDSEGEWRAQHWGDEDVDFSSGDDSEGEWLILTHAYDGDSVTINVNGETVTPPGGEAVDLDLSANRDIQIGRWERQAGDPMWYFDGRMAEITIFDRALDEEEIEAIEEYMSDEFGIALDGRIE